MRIKLGSSESIKAVMSGAAATAAPYVSTRHESSKPDVASGGKVASGSSLTALNGTTAVTLLSGVDGQDVVFTGLSLVNTDSAAITVTISHYSGSSRTIAKFTLAVGDSLYMDESGVAIYDLNGARKTVNASPLLESIGASTAAAGSTYADAGALPSGSKNYPTTAADGTKGVQIASADKITGNKIFIGNGVSNAILKVYPPTGGTINGASANVAFSSASGKGVIALCLDASANTWLAW